MDTYILFCLIAAVSTGTFLMLVIVQWFMGLIAGFPWSAATGLIVGIMTMAYVL